MKLKFPVIAALAASALLYSCVSVDNSLGENYLATNMKYDLYTAEFDIDDIELRQPDSLSSYSSYRFSIGAVRDADFGLTTRSAAFTLVPAFDNLDFGKPGTQVFRNFHLTAVNDSISTCDPKQANILQNVSVYALLKPLDKDSSKPEIEHGSVSIAKASPVLNGSDSLSIDFTEAFGKEYLTITKEELDSLPLYEQRFPGILLTCDAPHGEGGRINMFKLPLAVSSGSITGSYATLTFSAEYEGRGQVDTTFLFYLGPVKKYDLSEISSTSVSEYPQVAYNLTTHSSEGLEGPASDVIYFEGGNGLKPVVKAAGIREKVLDIISEHGDPAKAIINKATVVMPYDFPEDYLEMRLFPKYLSPTCRIVNKDESITFAGITDASISSENHGDINRSLCVYSPDITHHVQQLLKLEDMSKIENYDIWFLALADETTTTTTSGNNDMSEYYQQMAYANYYNSMYGGYGGYGYGGYGGYGSAYSNYYNYMMMAQMMNSSTTQTQTQQMMDFIRFYRAKLRGPAAADGPKIKITYSIERSE